MTQYLSYKFEDSKSFVDTYDELPLWSAPFGLLLLQHFRYNPGQVVVDIGSGTGFPLIEIAARMGTSGKCYGVDIWVNANDRVARKIANYGLKNVEIVQCSAEKMPFADSYVDVIVSNLGINNFDNPDIVFRECYRILKPGGRLMLTTNIIGHWKEFYSVFHSVLHKLGKTEIACKLQEQEMHRGDFDTISKIFTENGFVVDAHEATTFEMHFANGTAFLNHYFIKSGWLSSWLDIIPQEEREHIFSLLETELNRLASLNGQLSLTVPILYMAGVK